MKVIETVHVLELAFSLRIIAFNDRLLRQSTVLSFSSTTAIKIQQYNEEHLPSNVGLLVSIVILMR